jgi:hypothetical protein
MAGNISDTPASTTRSMPVCGSTSGSLSTNMSTMTSTRAPESLNWCAISLAVYSGLVFTSTQPAFMTPKATTG